MISAPDRSEQVDYVSSQLLPRAALLTRLLERETAYEISRTEAGILNVLSTGPRRITELAELEGLAQPTMTLLVKRLEDRQFVKRARPADDGRVVLVSLAPTGRRVLEDARARVAAAMHEYLTEASDEHIAALASATETLAQLIAILQARPPSGSRRTAASAPTPNATTLIAGNEMLEANSSRTKDQAAKVLRKAGIPADRIKEVLAELPDPFSVKHAEPIFARYGLTIEGLIDRMGASP
jgi:DNA-binding MarR family transcriptional regulator